MIKYKYNCLGCGKVFYSQSKTRKYCSVLCSTKFAIYPDRAGDKNPNWKGDAVGYYGIHDWVRSKAGLPKICKHCGSTKKPQWANISGKYKRDLTDWMTLCYWCHRKYDFPERQPCKCGKKYFSKGLCHSHYDKIRYLRLKTI